MILIYLIGAVTAILFLKFYLYKRRIMKYVGHLPSMPEIPFVGSGLYFLGKNSVGELVDNENIETLTTKCKNGVNLFGSVYLGHFLYMMDMLSMPTSMMETPCRFWLGPQLVVFLGEPDDVQTVLLSPKCLDKPYIYRFMNDSLGLLTAPAHIWKPQRKLLSPSFNNKILLSFLPIFNAKSQILAKVLAQKVGEKSFDVSKQIFACTLEMICSTTIGVDLEFQSNKNVEMIERMESQSELIANRMSKFWLHPDFIYKRTSYGKLYQENADCVLAIPKAIRKIKEKEFYESKLFEKTEELKEDEFFSTPQIFVNELFKLHHKKLLDDQMLDDQILTMLLGGNETSALTVSHCILMLAMNPEIQERVFQEIKIAHETQTSYTDAEIITNLDYLEMCIKETMRLWPIGPFIARQNSDEIKLSNCTVPKGTMLILSVHYLHRNKEVWGPNADNFNPDNFLPEKAETRHAYSYLPFSGGTRNCIGMKYAWLSMKTMLSAILRQYKFSTHLRLEDIVSKFEIMLTIDNRHMVNAERREY